MSLSLKNKLNRMKTHLGHSKESGEPIQPSLNKGVDKEIPYKDLWEENSVKEYWLEDEYCLIREVRFPFTFKQGNYRLGECSEAVAKWNQSNFSHPLSTKNHKIQDLFFFDTETTGLRGVGSTIFMLGYAFFTDKEVILKQHILTQPGAEVPLYMSFLENVDYTTLVTYNGKSFDWPQVKSRHTLIREHVPKLPEVGHFDLYHASRRLWKHKLESVKLSSVEENIIGFDRTDDLPGYLAPAIYFDFVERKHPEGMIKVLDHNEKDILSLISLYTHITNQLLGTDEKQSSDEQVEAGKWYKQTGDLTASRSFLNQAYNQDNKNTAAALSLAFSVKKTGEVDKAKKLFLQVSSRGSLREKREANIELAKIFEHQEKQYDLALAFAIKSMDNVREDDQLKRTSRERFSREITHRINRLRRK